MIELVVDIGVSPAWVEVLTKHGWTAVHWSTLGDPRAKDNVVMAWAREHRHVVFTHDLDFSTLEQAIYDRCDADTADLVHHSDRGMQYLSMRYTDRLADAAIEPSVGSRGDSYDNALAESVTGSSRRK